MEKKKKNKKLNKRLMSKILVLICCICTLFSCFAVTGSAFSFQKYGDTTAYGPVYPSPTVSYSGGFAQSTYTTVIDLSNTVELSNNYNTAVSPSYNSNFVFGKNTSLAGNFVRQQKFYKGERNNLFYDFITETNKPYVFASFSDITPGDSGYYAADQLRLVFTIDQPFVYKKGSTIDTIQIKNIVDALTNETGLYYKYIAKLTTNYTYIDKVQGTTYKYVRKANYSSNDSFTYLPSSKMALWALPEDSYMLDYNFIESSELIIDIYADGYGSATAGDYYFYPIITYENSYTPTKIQETSETLQRGTVQSVYLEKWVDIMIDGLAKIEYVKPTIPDLTSWLGTSVANFFDIELFYGIALSDILGIIIAVFFVVILLKFFAGG